METETYKNHLNSYIQQLENDLRYLRNCILPEFKTIDLNCGDISDDFQSWESTLLENGIDANCSVLYYISFENEDPKELLRVADKAKKKSKKKIALPQINLDSDSNILYVGKTNKNFPTRLRYHLGLVESRTYALHLKHWAGTKQFKLHFAKLKFDAADQKYLEQMETALHLALKPLLGRVGH